MTKLSELNIRELERKGNWRYNNPKISGIETSSFRVEKGHIFFAMPSKTKDNHGVLFSDQALARGASLVITDREGFQYALSKGFKLIGSFLIVENLEKALNVACESFYSNKPSFIMGVTGTNGKTSVVNLSQQLIEQNNEPCVTLGTLGVNGVLDLKTENTTPDQTYIHKVLNMAKLEKAEYAFLEVSSHSIVQKRIKGVPFNVFCFTNLSQDHLDYHKDMRTYFEAKLMILDLLDLQTKIIVNIDDKYGKIFSVTAKNKGFEVETIGFSDTADLKLKAHSETTGTQYIEITRGIFSGSFRTNLIGAFQAVNLAMAILTCVTFGFKLKDIVAGCKFLQPVPGRMELVGKTRNGSLVFIDFAHTPEALKHLLKTLRAITKGKLILVFGAGGERDKDKRKPMGAMALKYCDSIFVTDDNPRHEDSATIRRQVISGCPSAIEIEDRALAITTAIGQSKGDDIVIIAGKGHEKVQVIGDNYFPFSDFEQASIAIEIMG